MGLSPHPAVTMVTERRELADRLLCKLVQQRRMPVLGIGLGMQELNVVCGGGLFLHLPEDMPKGIPHRDPQGGAHRHTVVMQPGTRLEEIYGPGEIRVNSYHHQGIRKLAPNFRVAALAPDGLIEAFEGKDPSWWVTGVQWHPENEGNISLDMQLIEAFISAAAATKGTLTLAKASEPEASQCRAGATLQMTDEAPDLGRQEGRPGTLITRNRAVEMALSEQAVATRKAAADALQLPGDPPPGSNRRWGGRS